MNLAKHTHTVAAGVYAGAAAGMIGGVVGAGLKPDIPGPNGFHERLNDAFHGEEVHLRTIGAQAEHLGLDGQTVLAAGEIDAAQFIEPGGLVAEIPVPGQDPSMEGSVVVRMMEVSSPRGFRIFMEFRRGESLGRSILS